MEIKRPHVLVISGFDPSAGAGILADVKTIEALKAYAFGIVSALTHQDDKRVHGTSWIALDDIHQQVDILFDRFEIDVCKIGIMESTRALNKVILYLKQRNPNIKIIVDPVLKSSSGFYFQESILRNEWQCILQKLYLLTPNIDEMKWLSGVRDPALAAKAWSVLGDILLKGGHSITDKGTDLLFQEGKETRIDNFHKEVFPKHGSGCILSSAIAAFTALGMALPEACISAKKYAEQALNSNKSLLAYH